MTSTSAQIQMFTEMAELSRSLGNVHRLSLLQHIAQGERSVDRLAELSGLSVANTSQHLQHLRRAGFVQTRRNGKFVLYRLGSGPVIGLLTALRHYAEYNRSEIQSLVTNSACQGRGADAVTREELLIRLQDNDVTILDVRPEEEFILGHLPGALNIPIEHLKRRLAEIPSEQEIVAYCRGPYCVFSADAVSILQANGYCARELEDGYPEWKAMGLNIELSFT